MRSYEQDMKDQKRIEKVCFFMLKLTVVVAVVCFLLHQGGIIR